MEKAEAVKKLAAEMRVVAQALRAQEKTAACQRKELDPEKVLCFLRYFGGKK